MSSIDRQFISVIWQLIIAFNEKQDFVFAEICGSEDSFSFINLLNSKAVDHFVNKLLGEMLQKFILNNAFLGGVSQNDNR